MTGNRLDGSTAVWHSRDSLLVMTDSHDTTNPKGRT